jgi:hypothetical protein
VNDRNTGLMISPVADTLTFEGSRMDPADKGSCYRRRGSHHSSHISVIDYTGVQLQPTQEELTAYLNSIKSQIQGKIVLVGKPTSIDQSREPAPKRIPDEDNAKRYDPDPTKRTAGGPGGRGNQTPPLRDPMP